MRSVLVVVAFIVGACDSGRAPSPSDADCAVASSVFKTGPDPVEPAMSALLRLRCVEDGWSPAAVRCIRLAPSSADVSECRRQHFTVVQDEKLRDAVNEMFHGDSMLAMARFRFEMCECRDADCAKAVSDRMTKWSQYAAGWVREPTRMSEADQKRATELGTEMGECMQRAMSAGAN